MLQRICVCVCEWQARGTFDLNSAVDLSCVAPVLQCVAVCCSVLQLAVVCCSVLQCVAVCCSVLQCVAVCCSVLQYVAVCCSVCVCVYIGVGLVCVYVSVGLEERLIQILQWT